MTKNVGVIGLGAMGQGVARNLMQAGFAVYGCNVRAEILAQFASAGGIACASPAELGAHCAAVIVLVVNAEQTEAVLFGKDGTAETMKPGSVVISSATVDPGFIIAPVAPLRA